MNRLLLHRCALITFIVLVSAAFGQQPAPLNVTLLFDQPTYALSGEAVVQVLSTNTSPHPIFVYSNLSWGASASVSIWFKDKVTGKDLAEEIIHDSITPPPTSKDDFVKILPGHIYGRSVRFSIADLNIPRKGAYEVVAEYHSPVPRSYAFGLPIWSREDGMLRSNRITIKVRD